MTLAEAAPPPLNLASWNLCVLGVAVAGDTMHAEFVPMSQCRHLAIVACVDSLCAVRTYRFQGSKRLAQNLTHSKTDVQSRRFILLGVVFASK